MLNSRLTLDVANAAENIHAGHAIGQHDGFAGRQAGRQAHDRTLLQNDDRLGVLVHRRQVLAQALRRAGGVDSDGDFSANGVAANRCCRAAIGFQRRDRILDSHGYLPRMQPNTPNDPLS
jgi:hypothetical protein